MDIAQNDQHVRLACPLGRTLRDACRTFVQATRRSNPKRDPLDCSLRQRTAHLSRRDRVIGGGFVGPKLAG